MSEGTNFVLLLLFVPTVPISHLFGISRRQLLAFAMALHPRLGSASRASVLDDFLLETMLAPHLTPGPLASEIAEQNKKMKTVKLLNWLQAPEGATPTAEELYEGYPCVRRTLNI